MGLLERGLSWIGLFIALAPMLGFMGTVIGMIQAFDIIELKGEAKPDELAGGIKVALNYYCFRFDCSHYSSNFLQLYSFKNRFFSKSNGRCFNFFN